MTSSRAGWWRLNRWWLPAAPLALAAMLVASSIRIGPFWWDNGYHRAYQEVATGEWAEISDDGSDAIGDFRRDFRVRLEAVQDVDQFEPPSSAEIQELPPGSRAVTALLEFEADPEEILSGCTVVFVDADGTEYGGDQFDPLGQLQQCVPADRPGPSPAIFESAVERVVPPDGDRPEAWRTEPLMIVPEDAEITAVQIRYEPPDYVLLHATP